MKEKIDRFQGKYYFLSNFYEAPVCYNGLRFRNNEAAFQSQKNPSQAEKFTQMLPNTAKRAGRHAKLRADWENVKDNIMYDIVRDKFTRNIDLRKKLLDTGDAELIEGNTWGDHYWGVCDGRGKNKLGKILMRVREDFGGCPELEEDDV